LTQCLDDDKKEHEEENQKTSFRQNRNKIVSLTRQQTKRFKNILIDKSSTMQAEHMESEKVSDKEDDKTKDIITEESRSQSIKQSI
jgi:hypothetical protein